MSGPSIVVVAENVLVRNYLVRSLAAHDCRVFSAADSTEAHVLVRSCVGGAHLVVAALPVDGPRLASELATFQPTMQIVVMSLSSLKELTEMADAVLSGPNLPLPDDLAAAIQRALAAHDL